MFHHRSFKLWFLASIAALVATLVAASGFASAASAMAGGPLHITTSPKSEFTSFNCPAPDLCYVTVTGEVRSNLSTSAGRVEVSLVLTPVNGSFEPCNHVSEDAVFTFPEGTISIHSDHTDCPAWIRPGPRIDTEFQVTGGTGAFSGAKGGGSELGEASVVYNGTISY